MNWWIQYFLVRHLIRFTCRRSDYFYLSTIWLCLPVEHLTMFTCRTSGTRACRTRAWDQGTRREGSQWWTDARSLKTKTKILTFELRMGLLCCIHLCQHIQTNIRLRFFTKQNGWTITFCCQKTFCIHIFLLFLTFSR